MAKGVTSGDGEEILVGDILSRGQIVHLGLLHPRRPGVGYVVPMNYGYDSPQHCMFMHAGSGMKHDSSLKLQAFETAATTGAQVCFQVETDVRVLPMVGGTPCLSTTRYSSVLGFGTVELLQDCEEKAEGLRYLFRQSTGLATSLCPELQLEYLQDLVVIKLAIAESSVRRHGYGC